MDILAVQFLTESLKLLLLLLQLLSEVGDSLLELFRLDRAVSHLLLQLGNQLLVLLHACSDELYILLEFLLFASALTILQKGNAILGLINLVETILNLVDSTHQVVQLAVFLSNDTIERIILSSTNTCGSLTILTTS